MAGTAPRFPEPYLPPSHVVDFPVSELAADPAGALSPFGEIEFPHAGREAELRPTRGPRTVRISPTGAEHRPGGCSTRAARFLRGRLGSRPAARHLRRVAAPPRRPATGRAARAPAGPGPAGPGRPRPLASRAGCAPRAACRRRPRRPRLAALEALCSSTADHGRRCAARRPRSVRPTLTRAVRRSPWSGATPSGCTWSRGARIARAATRRGLGRPAAVLLRRPPTCAGTGAAPLGLPPTGQPRAGAAIAEVLDEPDRVAELVAEPTRPSATCSTGSPPARRSAGCAATSAPGDAQRPATRGAPAGRRGLLVADRRPDRSSCPARSASRCGRPRSGRSNRAAAGRTSSTASPAELDRLGTTAVLETLRLVDALGEPWTAHSRRPSCAPAGSGCATCAVRRRELGVDEPKAALIAEVAARRRAAQLDPRHGAGVPADARVRHLAPARHRPRAGLTLALGLAGHDPAAEPGRPARRPRPGDHRARPGRRARHRPGAAPPGARRAHRAARRAAPPSDPRRRCWRRLAWQAPRRASGQRAARRAILAEADLLGITAAGGLTGYSRTLLHGSPRGRRAGARPAPCRSRSTTSSSSPT